MRFTNAVPLVTAAREGGYAVPALNTNGATYDITRAALEAAEEMQAPVILQVYQPNIQYRGVRHFVRQVESLCTDLDITVPVCLQLDHGKSIEFITECIEAGFSSVMFDGSHDPLEVNVKRTRAVVNLAHARGVSVEAEIGYVPGNEPKPETQIGRIPVPERPTIAIAKTDPDEAKAFVQAVPVDLLAVSIGTIHGVYEHQTDIDFDLLETLRTGLDVPLVQHGTSGISLDDLQRLARNGMAKINFGEPFRYNFIRYFRALSDEMEHLWHAWRIMEEVKNRLKDDMRQLIQALGADGKAAR